MLGPRELDSLVAAQYSSYNLVHPIKNEHLNLIAEKIRDVVYEVFSDPDNNLDRTAKDFLVQEYLKTVKIKGQLVLAEAMDKNPTKLSPLDLSMQALKYYSDYFNNGTPIQKMFKQAYDYKQKAAESKPK